MHLANGMTVFEKISWSNWWKPSLLAALTGLLLPLALGCERRATEGKPERGGMLPPANPTAVLIEEKLPDLISSGAKPWLDTNALPIDTWYVQYRHGRCIGYSQISVAASETQGTRLIRLRKRDLLEIAAHNSQPAVLHEVELESLERPDGEFLDYTQLSRAAGVTLESTVRLLGDNLTVTKSVDGMPTSTTQKWPAGAWGPLGTISIFRQQPMQSEEFRSAQVFVPQFAKFVKVEMRSGKWEWTALPDGIVLELLPVETVMLLEGQGALTKNWLSKTGEIVKSVSPGGFTAFQTSRATAARVDSELRSAQLLAAKIPVSANAAQFQSSQITYEVAASNRDPFALISSKVNQQVKSMNAFGVEVTVFKTTGGAVSSPQEVVGTLVQDPPDAAYSQRFDASASQIQKFVNNLAAEPATLDTVTQLTEAVFKQLLKQSLSRQFVDPGKTLEENAGDCKAHAMLLIAVLRERGVPARAASGLRVGRLNNEVSAVYHMWCEAWLGDRWLPLDPFFGTVGVDVDHLKFLEASLNDLNPNTSALQVLQMMKQLTIAVKSP